MACRPATPAPMMNTLAALIVPAAVINMGKILGSAVGPQQHGAIAGDRRLRREHVHRLGAGDARQQFQAEERGPGAGDLAVRLGLAQRIAQADHDLALAQPRQVVLAALGIAAAGADLEDYVGGENFVARGDDLGPFIGVKLIGKTGRNARSRPAHGLQGRPWLSAAMLAGMRATRDFARKSLLWNANDHGSALWSAEACLRFSYLWSAKACLRFSLPVETVRQYKSMG